MLSRRVLGGAASVGVLAGAAIAIGLTGSGADAPSLAPTVTPIKHVVIIFDENISFDHYFGTYPNATNPAGQPAFTPAPGTPAINGLTPALLTANPNSGNPRRLDPKVPSDVVTCDFNHGYTAEQQAFHGGLMDKFPENTANGCADHTMEMNYYDGNTVTALWNYAQHYSMSDNSYGTTFGPSTIGAIHLVSGTTSAAVDDNDVAIATRPGVINNNTAYANGNPWTKYDDCSSGGNQYAFHGKNVGDLLSAGGVTWGWFQGGFKPSSVSGGGVATCGTSHPNVFGGNGQDYDAHHNPFAYYASTANPHHLAPSSTAAIGTNADQANHQYDVTDFDAALAAGNLPEVSFLKAGHYQDGHAGYSDPIDEQRWIVGRVNAIQSSPDWDSTAIIIAYDDSDGWYDHQASKIAYSSATAEDQLNGAGSCDHNNADPAPASSRQDQCGPGPRLPLLVISPYAKQNFVDHTETSQSSILKFIEDNWSVGRIGGDSDDVTAGSMSSMFDFAGSTRAPKLNLDPATGLVVSSTPPPGGGTTPPPGGGTTPPPPPPSGGGTVKPASIGKVKCKGKLKKRATKVTITCTTQHATTVATSIRLRLYKGKKQLATTSGKLAVKKKKLAIVLKSKKLKAGKYTLKVSIATVGLAARSQSLSIKI